MIYIFKVLKKKIDRILKTTKGLLDKKILKSTIFMLQLNIKKGYLLLLELGDVFYSASVNK